MHCNDFAIETVLKMVDCLISALTTEFRHTPTFFFLYHQVFKMHFFLKVHIEMNLNKYINMKCYKIAYMVKQLFHFIAVNISCILA